MPTASSYATAGVNIAAGESFADMVKNRIEAAWPSGTNVGGFAGTVQLKQPTDKLSAGADGSGTVAILGALTGRFSVIGRNAAAMSLVDTYVSGACPVGILDVIDVTRLNPPVHIAIIDGIIAACQRAEPCLIIGGETAELPDMFACDWMVNVNTTTIGIPEDSIITRDVRPGQPVYGWPSYGPASNGFTLIRKTFGLKGNPDEIHAKLASVPIGQQKTLADLLLVPTPVWVNQIEIQRTLGVRFAAHAHITGGGLVGNIPRILPPNCKVVIDRTAWQRPPVFRLIQEEGNITPDEMDCVFNQGIMVVSIINGDIEPTTPNAFLIGTVETRQGDEEQVQFTGTFQD